MSGRSRVPAFLQLAEEELRSAAGAGAASATEGARERLRWRWILGPRQDLIWFIGSAGIGYFYLALVFAFGRGLEDPQRGRIATLSFAGGELPLTLGLVVVASWAILLDAPHLFATHARTLCDREEWRLRGGLLLRSFGWFLLGPAIVLLPRLGGAALGIGPTWLDLPGDAFLIFFQLWAYYHVVRQHWGFLVLYGKKHAALPDPAEARADLWFFRAAMYLPLAIYLASPWYERSGAPPTGLHLELAPGLTLATLVFPAAAALYPVALAAYAAFQLRRLRRGAARSGPKLLLLLAIVPLHLVVFLHPLLAAFVVPAVTAGHNLQYHRIVWMYGRRKYVEERRAPYLGPVFRHVSLYAALGLAFTFLCYRGPLVDHVRPRLSAALAGLLAPLSAAVARDAVALFFLGWAMQHYYLDARIWRVGSDADVARRLEVG